MILRRKSHYLYILVMGLAIYTLHIIYSNQLHAEELRDVVNTHNVVFTYKSKNPLLKPMHYDGGFGMDTLKLQISPEEFNDPKFLADIIRFNYYLQNTMDLSSMAGQGEVFNFGLFKVSTQNIEILEIEVISNELESKVAHEF